MAPASADGCPYSEKSDNESIYNVTVFTAGLLACLLAAHYVGDFTPLSTGRMLEAKAAGGPVSLIASHAAVQAILVALVVAAASAAASAFDLRLVGVAFAIEIVTHFTIDLTRGRLGARYPNMRDPNHRVFWSVLGVDQLAHSLVLVAIAFLVAR